jgi:hypothetical protein
LPNLRHSRPILQHKKDQYMAMNGERTRQSVSDTRRAP